jgi:hypothetical protein
MFAGCPLVMRSRDTSCVCGTPGNGYPVSMSEPHVTLEQADLGPVPEKLRGPLEEQLSSALQRATEVVQNDYHGESVDEVAARVLEEARRALHPDIAHAFQPDPQELHRVAEVIVSRG